MDCRGEDAVPEAGVVVDVCLGRGGKHGLVALAAIPYAGRCGRIHVVPADITDELEALLESLGFVPGHEESVATCGGRLMKMVRFSSGVVNAGMAG